MKRLLLFAALGVALAAEPARAQGRPAPARVTVRLPAEARLYVDGVRAPLTSSTRTFRTPPLEPGRRYVYTLRAELDDGGRTARASRKVQVQAGRPAAVDFGSRRSLLAQARKPGKEARSPARLSRPQGAHPQQALAWVSDKDIIWQRTILMWKVEMRPDGKDDGKDEEDERRDGPGEGKMVREKVKNKARLAKVRAYRADGRRISSAQLRQLLSKPTQVLVSVDGHPVDPFYRQLLKKDTIILVPPLAYGAPREAEPDEEKKDDRTPREESGSSVTWQGEAHS